MSHEPCAMCARFVVTGHDEQAAQGNGWCVAWLKYVPWNGQIGVLFKPAPAGQISERRAFLARRQEKQTETA